MVDREGYWIYIQSLRIDEGLQVMTSWSIPDLTYYCLTSRVNEPMVLIGRFKPVKNFLICSTILGLPFDSVYLYWPYHYFPVINKHRWEIPL